MIRKNRGILTVVSGFSGSGKGTIMKELMKKYADSYALSISATTRNPRPGETDGVEYFFRTKEQFEQMIKDDALIEYAQFVGNYYGTPKAYVEEQLEAGKDVILEIETMDVIESRLARAVEEAEGIESYDYLVVNDVLEDCVEEVHQIIQNEHYRVNRNESAIQEMRNELKTFSK